MFLGYFEPKLDAKGRFILPAKFRDQLQGGLVMTRGQEHCLYVFTIAEFEKMHEQMSQAHLTLKEARAFQRVFFSGAVDDVPDKQGRILIPAILRQYANLERDLAVIGVGARLEIWNRDAWNVFLSDQESPFAHREEPVVEGLF